MISSSHHHSNRRFNLLSCLLLSQTLNQSYLDNFTDEATSRKASVHYIIGFYLLFFIAAIYYFYQYIISLHRLQHQTLSRNFVFFFQYQELNFKDVAAHPCFQVKVSEHYNFIKYQPYSQYYLTHLISYLLCFCFGLAF